MKKRLLAAFSLIPMIIVLLSNGQTSGDPCPAGEPQCFRDLVPYGGHNISASQLPPNLCPEGCAGDNRRVIVIRIDSSWGSTTNSNIWNAVHCAAAAWNNATDGASPPNRTGYYFAIDQGGLLSQSVPNADITVIKAPPPDGALASCDVGHDNLLPTRQNTIQLDAANGDLGVGTGLNMNAGDLCGRVAHELGHLIGLSEVSNCRSVMFGVNPNGSREVNTVQANDVTHVNQNFNGVTRGSCQANTPGHGIESVITPTPTPTPIPQESGSADCNDWVDNDGDGLIDCEDPGCGHYCVDGCNDAQWQICASVGAPYCVSGQCYTPILIDMLGNGYNMTDARNGVRFKVVNGISVPVSWTAEGSDDAWLVLDRNHNGSIDGGEEQFGNATPQPEPPPGVGKNGFLALAEYDKSANGGNGDGIINSSDAIFGSLLLWQDTNHNGVSEATELHGLSELGIATVELGYKESKRIDQYGNQFHYRAKVKDQNGNQIGRWAWDVFLKMR
jgi:hypothetical protein